MKGETKMIVEGTNVVRELVRSNSKIFKIRYNSNRNDVLQIINEARQKNIKLEFVEDKTKIATQGIEAEIPNFKFCDVEDILSLAQQKNEPAFILILDGIQDPHNLGALIRSAECAGVHGIIIPENRASDITSTVYKTSAGAVCWMKISKVVNLTRAIKQLKEVGVWVYALEADGKNIYEENFTYSTALVVGSEGKGVTHLVRQTADVVVSLDMFGQVNSLNASNAGAIAMYEVVRQRKK